jgi:hypothetical protein
MEELKIDKIIPHNWLDPLLTGKTSVIGKPPYSCDDIEKLLNAIRKRLEEWNIRNQKKVCKWKLEERNEYGMLLYYTDCDIYIDAESDNDMKLWTCCPGCGAKIQKRDD